MTDKYCVFGNPISHSKSPFIHSAFARQTRQDIEYTAMLATIEGFADAVANFIATGGRGANVTVPFKQDAFQLVTRLTARAELAGAANTLVFEGDSIIGDNTDGVGLLRDIMVNLGFPISDKRILLLGAGGAARGVIAPLLEQQPQSVAIANRTASRAAALAEHFTHLGPVSGCGYSELGGRSFDIVIDATSAALSGTMQALPAGTFAPGSLAYEMMYGRGETPFQRLARNQGAAMISDGLGMLVEQAAESFFVWRGVRPDCAPVMELLRGA
jgi:shikimate dehydrogenase